MPTTTNQIPVACFAPELTADKIAEYTTLIGATDPTSEVGDALRCCLTCVQAWHDLPVSTRQDSDRYTIQHLGETVSYSVTPLEESHIAALWNVTPWMNELNMLSNSQGTGVFDQLTGELRNCAFHLLWYCKEITLDREPLSQDKL